MVVNTPAHRLFHHYYLFAIPACDYYDPKFIQKFGMHQHPDEEIAKAMLYDRIHAQFSPAYMAAWAAEGIDIRFYDAKDAVIVYNDIMAHLRTWVEYLEGRPLISKIPMQGLFEFHMFARLIYKIARENGLADQFRVDNNLREIGKLFRNGVNKNTSPFRFRFNANIWLRLTELASEMGYDVKRYRDKDLVRFNDDNSEQSTLGSINAKRKVFDSNYRRRER